MAPIALRKLVAMQGSRIGEIQAISRTLLDRDRDSLNLDIVVPRLEEIKDIWGLIRETHTEIITRDDARNDAYIINGNYADMRNSYEEMLDRLYSLKAHVERRANVVQVENAPPVTRVECGPSAAKLPKISLPKFSGNFDQWESFRGLFVSLVHSLPDLSGATKLQYLNSCLTGTAAELLENVDITNENYLPTWQALNERFHNPRLTVHQHFNSLWNLPILKRESASDLRIFLDEARKIVRALKSLGLPVHQWDLWFVHILSTRLDSETRKLWEAELSLKDRQVLDRARDQQVQASILDRFSTYKDLVEFMERRAQTLTMAVADTVTLTKSKPSAGALPPQRRIHHVAASRKRRESPKCELCRAPHHIRKCSVLLAKSPTDRHAEIKKLKLCFKCMGPHRFRDCSSKFKCEKCHGAHHTLLHFDTRPTLDAPASAKDKPPGASAGVTALTTRVDFRSCSILPVTAILILESISGQPVKVRAMLDQGAEASFISQRMVKLLGLTEEEVDIPLVGIGEVPTGSSNRAAFIKIRSPIDPNFDLELCTLVLPSITKRLPERQLADIDFELLNSLTLADPEFYRPGKVDVMIGLDAYGLIVRPGFKYLNDKGMIAQDTAFGWAISGPLSGLTSRRAEFSVRSAIRARHVAPVVDLGEQLRKFWELEELSKPTQFLSPAELKCEDSFRASCTRDSSGRFCVALPLKSNPPSVSHETRGIALGALRCLHRRFRGSSELETAYRDFMAAYENLGHMTRIPAAEIENARAWYLPHHAVIRAEAPEFKLRVVFDASRRVRQGSSLNDHLLPGPALQRDLSLILTRWRCCRFAFTADIVKMFRQIGVTASDQDLQRILWSPSAEEPPVDYRLTTVTYGTSCAPFLAIRTLLQLADLERTRFPLGAHCLEHETYVDDTFSGADTLEQAIQIRNEFVAILQSAGIKLDKWAANHADLLKHDAHTDDASGVKRLDYDSSIKTLGLLWNPGLDQFNFTISFTDGDCRTATKRVVLSAISRIFDPLGWLAPVTIVAKILMQDLWILGCNWDEPLPYEIQLRWKNYCSHLFGVSNLSIKRWIGSGSDCRGQLHGFSDASRRAYAAVVYFRSEDENGDIRVTLLASKTKVSPIKTVSIPHLELCGAALLTKLLVYLRGLDFFRVLSVHCWTDSQIVLRWIEKHPACWKTFVANRVSSIQTDLPEAKWSHVSGMENPSDLTTRGLTPEDLCESELWWHGPSWLGRDPSYWPHTADSINVLRVEPEEREPLVLRKFSSIHKLDRVIAYCLRVIKLRRRSIQIPDFSSRRLGVLELRCARIAIIKSAQDFFYPREIVLLSAGNSLPIKHPLSKLNPYYDKDNQIIRIGGRLTLSKLSEGQKHPPILPASSAVSRLFVEHAHKMTLHGGITLTSSFVTQNVWITGRNRLVKKVVRRCMVCQKLKPRLAQQLMGPLPAARITPSRAFSTSGLDYAGPFWVRVSRGRGIRADKSYIALFICFATKAIHLELVGDLTTKSFISALRRFVGRRGICSHLYSDNAAGFKGADTELRDMFRAASDFYEGCSEVIAKDGISWTFIPPTTPHFGGLWEAGIKSMKYHLKRAIGETILTYEEMNTVLVEIGSCLNSRPLCPLTSEPDDLDAITPSHLLLGTSSGMLPDLEPFDAKLNRLDRFQLLQRIRNQFWKRWTQEYLLRLQERNKWRGVNENFSVGQLVLLRNESYPPSKWPLGRIVEVFHGSDGLVRVVNVKTSSGVFRRHVVRLSPLRVDDSSGSD